MAGDLPNAPGKDRYDLLAEEIDAVRGSVRAVNLPGDEAWELTMRLNILMDTGPYDPVVRMVLGSACTTAAKTIEQFVVALQLPYAAARGWSDFLEHLGGWSASRRQCLVVAEACGLLRYEDPDRWQELVYNLYGGPHCLGGGWSTVVLADHESAWEGWEFQAVADARFRDWRSLLRWEVPPKHGA
jgi:hypothetical protein